MKPAPDRRSAAGRYRYADLLRVVAIGAVAVGHWLLTSITYRDRRLSGLDAVGYVSWAGWVTLAFQVMPVFFLVGGYVHAGSWARHQERGGDWAGWVRAHAMGLLWPAAVYVTVAVLAVEAARMAGAGTAELAQAGWLVALQLWFLPVYLLLIALTPAMLAAYRRWGLAVPAVMAVGAAAVDVGVVGGGMHVVGYANYLLVWGSIYVWGFAWRDGTLTRPRWRPYALAVAGAGALAGLVTWGPFPVDMIGAGERVANTSPPSIALLAYAAAQTGLVLAAAPAVSRLLARPRWWQPVSRLDPAVMLAADGSRPLVAVVEGAQAGPGDDDPGDGQVGLFIWPAMSSRLNAWPRLTVTLPAPSTSTVSWLAAAARTRSRWSPRPGSSTPATSAARSGARGSGSRLPSRASTGPARRRTSSTSPGSHGRTPVWAGLTTATFFRRARRMTASAAVTTVLPTPVSVPVTKQTVMGRSRALPGAAP